MVVKVVNGSLLRKKVLFCVFNIFHISQQASHRLQCFSWLSPFPSPSAVSSKWSRWEFYLGENLLGQAAENQVEFYLDKNQVEFYLDKNQVEFLSR